MACVNCFKRWDTDGNGAIDRESFCHVLNELAESMKIPILEKKLAVKIFDSMDKHKSGQMSFQAFHQFFLKMFATGHVKLVFDPLESSTDAPLDLPCLGSTVQKNMYSTKMTCQKCKEVVCLACG